MSDVKIAPADMFWLNRYIDQCESVYSNLVRLENFDGVEGAYEEELTGEQKPYDVAAFVDYYKETGRLPDYPNRELRILLRVVKEIAQINDESMRHEFIKSVFGNQITITKLKHRSLEYKLTRKPLDSKRIQNKPYNLKIKLAYDKGNLIVERCSLNASSKCGRYKEVIPSFE